MSSEDRLLLATILLASLTAIWLWKARIATPVILLAAGAAGALLA